MSGRERTRVEKFLRNPKQMLAAMLLVFGVSVSFLWNTWEADSWQEAVVYAAISLVCVVAGGKLLGRIEMYFSPNPILWLGRRERDLLSLIASNKACGAPYLRDGKLYVCQVPPHTDGVNHHGLYMMKVSSQNPTVDLSVDGTGKLDIVVEDER